MAKLKIVDAWRLLIELIRWILSYLKDMVQPTVDR
jgi:hypothetical protein